MVRRKRRQQRADKFLGIVRGRLHFATGGVETVGIKELLKPGLELVRHFRTDCVKPTQDQPLAVSVALRRDRPVYI